MDMTLTKYIDLEKIDQENIKATINTAEYIYVYTAMMCNFSHTRHCNIWSTEKCSAKPRTTIGKSE